jgi:Undecaprenyl-phosphate glucose phosphotransferase
VTLLLVLASHGMCRHLLASASRSGYLTRNVVVIGAGEPGQRLLDHFAFLDHPDVSVLGVFDDRTTRVNKEVAGVPVLGGLDDAEAFIRRHKVDQVLVTLPLNAEKRIGEIVGRLRLLPVDILLTMGWAGYFASQPHVERMGNVPLLSVTRRPISGWAHAAKLAEDLLLGGLLALVLAPVMALIALAVKLDSPGPVFFRQPRYGFNNELIEVFKFRTMYHEASDAAGSRLTERNDPRITRLGHFLRRTSLDELPQIFNVLNGSMSLVGPRPHATEAKAGELLYDEAVQAYAARHRVKPGITGWAQVNGWRGETDTVEKIEQRVLHDLYYIENWSLTFDIKILFLTVFAVLTAENAF